MIYMDTGPRLMWPFPGMKRNSRWYLVMHLTCRAFLCSIFYFFIDSVVLLFFSSECVLRDYKNYFKPKAGINKENVESLREKTFSFSLRQRYVAIIIDEMKIQSNLVFDKVSGDLIGFINLGNPMTNFACLTDEDPVSSHALAFLVRGLCTDLKHVIAYFFAGNVTSFQLMPLFWRTVSVLEVSLKLCVCCCQCKVCPIKRFFNCIPKWLSIWNVMLCINFKYLCTITVHILFS